MATSNYNWPTPVQTDLVKDGWEAIKDLGDAADTTVKAVSDAQGLVHIKQQSTGGAVSSISVDDVFSATYNTYLVIMDLAASATDATINLRLRVGGSDTSTGIYRRQFIQGDGTSLSGTRETTNTSFVGANIISSNKVIANNLLIFNPFETVPTTGKVSLLTAPSGNIVGFETYLGINNTTSYTGFTILVSTGTIDGTITVMGYRK